MTITPHSHVRLLIEVSPSDDDAFQGAGHADFHEIRLTSCAPRRRSCARADTASINAHVTGTVPLLRSPVELRRAYYRMRGTGLPERRRQIEEKRPMWIVDCVNFVLSRTARVD